VIWVTSAVSADEYKILLRFNDGFEGVLDFKPLLIEDVRAVVKQLMDLELFKRFKVEMDTVCWDNGVDFAPDYLYEKIKQKKHVA